MFKLLSIIFTFIWLNDGEAGSLGLTRQTARPFVLAHGGQNARNLKNTGVNPPSDWAPNIYDVLFIQFYVGSLGGLGTDIESESTPRK